MSLISRDSSSSSGMMMEGVCASTASLNVSSIRDSAQSPSGLVSSSTTTSETIIIADQFDDAPEDDGGDDSPAPTAVPPAPVLSSSSQPVSTVAITTAEATKVPSSFNPLDALAMACVAEKIKKEEEKKPTTPKPKKQTKASAKASSSASKPDPSASSISDDVSTNDVLCGRGGLTNHHSGNVFFRRLVRVKQETYLRASKREKAGVAREIVDLIRQLDPPGRFLKKDTANPGQWIDIGDKKAREKTSQALREGAPELREELAEQQQQQQQQLSQLHQQHFNNNVETPKRPKTSATTATSNRARVVSADSGIAGLRPLFHSIAAQQQPQQPHVVMDDSHYSQHQQVAALHHYSALACAYAKDQHQQQTLPQDASSSLAAAGTKRKSIDALGFAACHQQHPMMMAVESSSMEVAADSPSSAGRRGGPRLKLLKSRLNKSP